MGFRKDFVDFLRGIYDEPNTIGYYSCTLDQILIFPNKLANLGANARVVKGNNYHESTHQVLFKNFSDEEVAATAALIRKYYPDIKEYVEKKYKKESDRIKNEEVICTLVGKEAENGRLGFLTNTSDFKIKELTRKIDDIVEFLKDRNYGNTRIQRAGPDERRIGRNVQISRSSRGETETDAGRGRILGGNEETLQGDAGEDEERGERREEQPGEQSGDRISFMSDEGAEAEDSEVREDGGGEGEDTAGADTEGTEAEAAAMEPVAPEEMSLKEQILQGLMEAANRYGRSRPCAWRSCLPQKDCKL